MKMTREETFKDIPRRVRLLVTPQRVTVAKALVFEMTTVGKSYGELVSEIRDRHDITVPEKLVVHDTIDSIPMVIAFAEDIAWRIATAEAMWSLIYSGQLRMLDEPTYYDVSVNWTSVTPASGGGENSSLKYPEFNLSAPAKVIRTFSSSNNPNQYLCDADQYLSTMNIAGMHKEIASSLSEAIRCFRTELFTASLAMLGKASEGAWLELGVALLDATPVTKQPTFAKQREVLEDSGMGTLRKVGAVVTIYSHEIFKYAGTGSGIKAKDLMPVQVWSDSVRDARNTIHFGVTPAAPNTYEKVAVLLIGAISYLRTLYAIRTYVNANPAT